MKDLQTQNLASLSVVELFIYAKGADSSSTLGIILGNFGLNMNNFCNEFNGYTKSLPSYFLLKVRIVVFENRTFAFSVTLANLGYYLSLFSFERSQAILQKGRLMTVTYNCILLNDFWGVFRLKFPRWSAFQNISLFLGVLSSCDIKLVLY